MLVTWNGVGDPTLQAYTPDHVERRLSKGNVFPGGKAAPTLKELTDPCRYVNFHSDRKVLEFGVDPLGFEKLFFCVDRGTLYLSDTMDAMLRVFCVHGKKPVIPRDALLEMLIFRYNSGRRTLVQGIDKAEAGQIYRCDEHLRITTEPSWNFDFDGDYVKASDDELIEEFNRLFAEIIRGYPVEDRDQIAVALTGGVDSSFIQTYLRDLHGDDLFSFSMQYNEGDSLYDETPYALSAAAALGSRHSVYTMSRADFLESIARTIAAAGYPLSLSHTAQNFWTQRQLPAMSHFIFSGYGADAVFGSGTGKFWLARKLSPYRFLAEPGLSLLAAAGGEKRRLQVSAVKRYWGKIERVEDAIACFPELDSPVDFALVCELFTPDEIAAIWEPRLAFLRSRNLRSIVDVITSMKLFSLSATVSSQYGAARSIGKEILFPFCDRRILAFTKDIRPDQHLKHWGLTKKHLLRQAAMRRLPKFIIERRKQSGELPLRTWMRDGLFEEMLAGSGHEDLGIDYDRLKRLALRPGKFNDFLYWGYVNTALWKDQYLSRFGTVEVAAA